METIQEQPPTPPTLTPTPTPTLTPPTPLQKLNGKNIFVFDTETTGLPNGSPSGWGSYWSYNINEKYENARIVSIAWSAIHNYNKETSNINNIEHHLRYPEGFTEITNSHIHGITYEDTIKNGIKFNDLLLKHNLCVDILKSDYIVAHNVNFDYHILMNELYRLGTEHAKECMLHLSRLKEKGRCICTGEISTNICKMDFPSNPNNYKGYKTNKYKMPKLSELYVYYYGKEFENQHSADGDVKALLEIMKKM